MKNSISLTVYLLLVFAISSGLHCKDGNEPDPCALLHPTTADFEIAEYGGPSFPDNWKYYDTDTLILNAVKFTAKENGPGVKYEWILGAETLNVRSFYRTDFPFNQPLSVRLTVSKIPNNTCFPLDDGKEEKVRSFYIKSGWQSLVHGKFRGVNITNPQDTLVVEFDTDSITTNHPKIIGLPHAGCVITNQNDYGLAYRQFYFGHNGDVDCSRPMGVATISGAHNEKLTFKYTMQRIPGVEHIDDRIQKKFIGTRVP